MAQYGSFPGVQITTSGGGLSGIQVGEQEKLVLFGPGPGDGSSDASVNTATQVTSLSDADTQFGEGTHLSAAVKQALANGANQEFLYGVLTEQVSVTDEDVSDGGTATDHAGGSKIANAPLVEDTDSITFTDTSDSSDLDVVFKYETNTDNTTTDFTALSPGVDEVFVNPLTGEWVANSGSSFEIDYEYYDYESAIDSAEGVVEEGETGIFGALTEAPDVHSHLSTAVTALRKNFQMVQGVAGARPNRTGANGNPAYDTSSYSDTTDNDSLYLLAPARQRGVEETIIGAVAGLMAGHTITNPVYNDAISSVGDLQEKLTGTQAGELRDVQVMPVRQSGSIRVKGNLSTSTSTDWERDFWRRRIVDRVLLVTKQVGDATIGRINDSKTREDAENVIFAELVNMVDDRLLKPNTDDETRWYVTVSEEANNADELNIDIGMTPVGIVKRVDESVTIST